MSYITVDDIEKFCDPLYAESDVFVPEDVKYQLILSEEDKLKEALNQFEKLESLKPILDSQAFRGTENYFLTTNTRYIFNFLSDVPDIGGRLSKILAAQSNQEKEVEALTINTYQLLQHYNDIVSWIHSHLNKDLGTL